MTSKMLSSWDETKANSSYHFDKTKLDTKQDMIINLGKFKNVWANDINDIVKNSHAVSWASRGYTGKGIEGPPEELEKEENDLKRAGYDPKFTISHLNWSIPECLLAISDKFELEQPMNRIHVQMPGEVWNLHIDKLQKWCPDDYSRIMRIFIQLSDWEPGQFWEYGNFHYNRWAAGDCTTFDWQNTPHSTANAGHNPRVTLQITGNKTSATDLFLKKLKNTSAYIL